jgi:hypothetical protein
MKKILLLVGLTAGIAIQSQASVTYKHVTNDLSQNIATDGTFSFAKFNTALGTLTGVKLKIVSSVDSGSYNVTNNGSVSAVKVKTPNDTLTVIDNQSSGAGYGGSQVNVTTTPGTTGVNGYSLAARTGQTFTFADFSLIGGSPVEKVIDSSYFAAYEGAGFVTFDVYNSIITPVTGSNYQVNADNWINTTALDLIYDYEAAATPEPGQVAASMLLMAGIGGFFFVRQRKAKLVA